MQEDIDLALDCDVDWVGIFYCLTNKSLEQRYRKDFGEVVHVIVKAVEYAKSHGLKVRYTPEDTVRSDFHKVVTAAQAAVSAGADRISIADTTGIMTPLRMYNFVKRLKKKVKVDLNVHCHNDLGMATANSISAISAGARLVDVTINGLGERAGIAPLAETAVALKLGFGIENHWDLSVLPQLSEMVEKFTGIKVPTLAPIVGKNAFTHNAGLHVAAVLMDPTHYESIPVDLIGRRRRIAIDRMAGRPTIRFKLRELGINVTEQELDMVMGAVKGVGTSTITDAMLKGFVRNAKRSMTRSRRGGVAARRGRDAKAQDDGDGWWNELCGH